MPCAVVAGLSLWLSWPELARYGFSPLTLAIVLGLLAGTRAEGVQFSKGTLLRAGCCTAFG